MPRAALTIRCRMDSWRDCTVMPLPTPRPARFLPHFPTAPAILPRHRRRLQQLLCLLMGLCPLATLGGCSLLLARHVPRRIDSLSPRHHRPDVMAELGAPRQSVTFSRPTEAPAIMFPPAGRAVRRDEYEVGGLRLAPGDGVGSASRWAWYPLELVTSVGTQELSTLPDTVGELVRRAEQRDRLRVWYDRDGRVLTWEVHSARYPEEPPERPFDWARRFP